MGRLAISDWENIMETIERDGYSIVPLLADRYAVSREAINRHLRKSGIRRRGRRSDAGRRKLSKESYYHLATLCTVYRRTAEDAIKDAIYSGKISGRVENGEIVESELNPNTLRKYLKSDDLNRKSLLKKGAFRLGTKAPLEVLQWDSTRATQWFVEKENDDDTIISFVPPQSENKNRSRNKAKLSFFVFQDMFSRKVWFKVVSVENTVSFLDFFYELAAAVGMPKVIYTDNASIFHRTGRVARVLDKLGVSLKTHSPGNARAKGMVERTIRTLEERARITLIEKAKTLKEYNKIVKYLQDEYNNRVHSTTKASPNSLFYSHYALIDKLLPPSYEDFRRLMPRFDFRQLKHNLSVGWQGKIFQARDSFHILTNYVGKQVRVEDSYKQGGLIYIIVEGKEIEAVDVSVYGELTKSFGEYKELPSSRKEKLLKEMSDYNGVATASYEKRFSSDFKEYDVDPRRIIGFDIAKIRLPVREHNLTSARYYLAKSGIVVNRDIEEVLYNLFGTSEKVSESALDALIKEEKQA